MIVDGFYIKMLQLMFDSNGADFRCLPVHFWALPKLLILLSLEDVTNYSSHRGHTTLPLNIKVPKKSPKPSGEKSAIWNMLKRSWRPRTLGPQPIISCYRNVGFDGEGRLTTKKRHEKMANNLLQKISLMSFDSASIILKNTQIFK